MFNFIRCTCDLNISFHLVPFRYLLNFPFAGVHVLGGSKTNYISDFVLRLKHYSLSLEKSDWCHGSNDAMIAMGSILEVVQSIYIHWKLFIPKNVTEGLICEANISDFHIKVHEHECVFHLEQAQLSSYGTGPHKLNKQCRNLFAIRIH